jgi:hypothetical protein
MDKARNPVILSVIYLRPNPLEFTYIRIGSAEVELQLVTLYVDDVNLYKCEEDTASWSSKITVLKCR